MKLILKSLTIILLFSFKVINAQAKDTVSDYSTNQKASALRVLGEVTLSPVSGVLCTTPFAFALLITSSMVEDWQHLHDNINSNGPYQNTINVLSAAGCLAYVTGNAWCIYLFASDINKDLSFWPVLGLSAAGFAIGAYTGLEIRSIGPVLILTTLLPVIYVNALAPHSTISRSNGSFNFNQFSDQGRSYKDYYNRTLSLNINFPSIQF